MKTRPIYLDCAATTPLDPAVLNAMLPYFGSQPPVVSRQRKPRQPTNQLSNQLTSWGNPGSLHSFGQQASAAVFAAREEIAQALRCHYSEIIFTGGATEANNLALRGAVKQFSISNVQFPKGEKPRIIISSIEHESVMATAKDLEKEGVEVVRIPVSREGIVNLKMLKEALTQYTILVSVMYANNEVGTIQPIAQMAKMIREFRSSLAANRQLPTAGYPLFHTDAVQAFQYLPCDVQALGVDLLTLSAHKMYGPKGIGCLYTRLSDSNLQPVLTGGGQEFGLRSGTENVPSIVGFARAMSLAAERRTREAARVEKLRNQLWRDLKHIFPKAQLNGGMQKRLPNNLNVYLPGISGEQLLVSLDLQGVAVSSGSACTARSIDPSHVIMALSGDSARAKNSIRITLGRTTTGQELKNVISILGRIKSAL